jgi:aquaporin related protein
MTGHFVAATGEFVGTFMFLFFAFSCQIMLNTQASDTSLQNGRSSSQTNVFIALIYGLSLLVNVWAFFRISGGLFNPAVSNCSDARSLMSHVLISGIILGHLRHGDCRNAPSH